MLVVVALTATATLLPSRPNMNTHKAASTATYGPRDLELFSVTSRWRHAAGAKSSAGGTGLLRRDLRHKKCSGGFFATTEHCWGQALHRKVPTTRRRRHHRDAARCWACGDAAAISGGCGTSSRRQNPGYTATTPGSNAPPVELET